MTYQLVKNNITKEINFVQYGNLTIPFDPDNTDYQAFKKEINDQTAQLEDADGNLMTAQQAIDYVATLP